MSTFALTAALFFTSLSFAQGRRAVRVESSRPSFSYDIGGSSGSYNGHSYTEINLGLNWYFLDYLIWRNALWTRFGSNTDSASGLDTSARFVYNLETEGGGLGLGVFGGPGLRISNKENTGIFGEAGVTVKAGGLHLGVGVRSLTYNDPGKNSDGTSRPKSDNTVFIIVAGGGAF